MSLVQFRPEAPSRRQSPLKIGIAYFHVNTLSADLAHLVERDLAKVEVAGSSPVIRSTKRIDLFDPHYIRRHSQVVRQRSAKPLCPSSNLGGASRKKKEQVKDLLFLFFNEIRLRRVKFGFAK